MFESPHDKLIWDVGHQAYPHKMLTGRRHRMHTLRQGGPGGSLSGFTKRSESVHDCFGAGHSSTALSVAVGFALARDIKEQISLIKKLENGDIQRGFLSKELPLPYRQMGACVRPNFMEN